MLVKMWKRDCKAVPQVVSFLWLAAFCFGCFMYSFEGMKVNTLIPSKGDQVGRTY